MLKLGGKMENIDAEVDDILRAGSISPSEFRKPDLM